MEYPGCEVVDGPWSGDYADDLRKEVWILYQCRTLLRSLSPTAQVELYAQTGMPMSHDAALTQLRCLR